MSSQKCDCAKDLFALSLRLTHCGLENDTNVQQMRINVQLKHDKCSVNMFINFSSIQNFLPTSTLLEVEN